MNADDARHGTLAGHVAGCRELCCRTAKNQYEATRIRDKILRRPPRTVPAVGVQRRIRALMVLGWTAQGIAETAGWTRREYVNGMLRRTTVREATAVRVGAVYDQLSMHVGPSELTRQRAAAKGWAPPLAWDDATIDNPEAEPYRSRRRSVRDQAGRVLQPTTNHVEQQIVDHVIVNRAMNGQKVDATPAERAEIARRWHNASRSIESLNDLQGWNLHRDARKAAA